MGVTQTHYVIVGVKYNFEHFDDEFRDSKLFAIEDNGYGHKIIKNQDNLTVVSDGMNGEYIIIGRVLAKGLEHEGIELTRIDEFDRVKISNDISKLIDQPVSSKEIYIYVFTHFH